jgi:tRNA(Ile)-lysidine synthetase-like protein
LILPPGGKLLLAISGGADSVALLAMMVEILKLSRLKTSLPRYELFIAHYDHELRVDSAKDCSYVVSLAHYFGIPCFISSPSIREKDELQRSNLEMWARERRYAFFERIRLTLRCNFVLTAHHQDDVVETFLMRLFANKELKALPQKDLRRKIWRPLYYSKKKDLLQYLKEKKINFCEDLSNTETNRTRNLIRHRIIPHLIEELGESVTKNIFLRTKRVNADIEALESVIKRALKPLAKFEQLKREWLQMLCKICNELPVSCKDRAVALTFQEFTRSPISFLHAKRLTDFIFSNSATCQLPHLTVARRDGGIVLTKSKDIK